MATYRTISGLCEALAQGGETLASFKADPMPALVLLATRESRRAHNDTFIYRCIVVVLCIILLSILAFVLAVNGQAAYEHLVNKDSSVTAVPVPEYLIALGSTALGALAGLLAPAPQGRTEDV